MPLNSTECSQRMDQSNIVIAGAGIVGLVLALALEKHCGIKVELYEQAKQFQDGVGAGIGMYPNGLRVIRDISPELVQEILRQGYPYLFRRWEVSTVVVYEVAPNQTQFLLYFFKFAIHRDMMERKLSMPKNQF